MINIKKLLLMFPLVLTMLSVSASAKNNVSEIDIDVKVQNDGSAHVIQAWTGSFNEGTENYIPINTGDIGISNLSVSDSFGKYDFIDNWDINADFDAKKRKCGISKTNYGVEICFGISEYGENEYKIEYLVSDFIKSYSDYDGTNFMFVNPNMSTFPTNAKIKISMENGTELNTENAAVWTFGYDGQAVFDESGFVSAYTDSALNGDNSMIIMLRLNKNIIFPSAVLSKSFEEVKNKAFEGSDYGYDEDCSYYDDYSDEDLTIFDYIIGFAVSMIIPAIIFLIIAHFVKRKKAIKKFYNDADYFREVPNGGNIELSHYLAQNFGVSWNESLIIGALMLSMINKHSIEPETEEQVGIFGKTKQSVNMRLLKEPDTAPEKKLYDILVAAAGEDGILQEKELESYAYNHPQSVNGIINDAKEHGKSAFIADGGFSDGAGNCIKDLSEKGKSELAEVMGLKKYLNDFSLIAEREINETIIWQDYMVYATLFGIADKVINQLKNVYPDKVPEFENYSRNVIITQSYYHSMHDSARRAEQEARTDGFGGHASLGGGGGFSGGGSGGGSR